MAKKTKVNYDAKEDILSLAKADRVKESLRIGDVILDFDGDYRIVGVEIFNARSFFKAFRVTKKLLSSVENAKLSVHYSPDWAMISIVLYPESQDKAIEKEFTIPALEEQAPFARASA